MIDSTRRAPSRPSAGDLLTLTLVAILYIAAAKLGLRLAFVHASATAVWPPAGIALAALLLRGYRMWPAVFVGAFVANVTTAGSIATSLGIAAGNSLEAVTGAYLVTRFASGRQSFARGQDVVRFVGLSAIVSTTVSATLGVGSLVLGGFALWSRAPSIWLTWWLGDAAGIVLVAPLLILWAEDARLRGGTARLVETGLMFVTLVAVGQVVFGSVLPGGEPRAYPIDFLAVPPLVWAAFRLGQRETATASFVLAAMALWGTLHGQGPFHRNDPNESLLLLQAFMGLSSVLALAFSAVVAEKKRVDEERLALVPVADAARELAETSAKRARFLSEVSAVLGSSIEYDAALVRLTKLAIPVLADYCAVDLVQEDGTIRCVARAHIDPGWEAPPASVAPDSVQAVLRTRESVLVSHDTREASVAASKSETRETGFPSWMVVPLIARQRMLGTITFAVTEPARRYGAVDLSLAETVAHRAASAIEKARLYREAQAARAEAETANRLKDEFLAMLGHELRNPLGAISNAVHILDRVEDSRDHSAAHARDVITRQVQHLGGLIDDLLDVGRVMTGKIRLDRGALDLFQAVGRALNTLSAAGKTRDHAIRVKGESVWIHGDVTRIEQIVLNLVENALRYTPAGGSILVDAYRDGTRAVLRVEDTGMGIDPGLLPRIFDLFVQGDRGPDRAHGGLGIGLTLVKRLVELHDGTAEAVSTGPGAGSTFIMTFPALSLPALPETANPAAPVPARRIVIVEDNADSRETLRVLFEIYGHQVHEAADGPAGVDLVLRLRPDAAFVDVGLPGFDGYELARRIRATPDGDQLCLIAVTGYGLAADQQLAREAGFNFHLVKPVHPHHVNELLRHLGPERGHGSVKG